MSNKSRLQTNNNNLLSNINKANNLPGTNSPPIILSNLAASTLSYYSSRCEIVLTAEEGEF
jgi:hypothetical protein